jgi:hypothetical protein
MGEAGTRIALRDGPGESAERYRVELLPGARIESGGVVYREDGERRVLAWGRIEQALAAEVGEPEGVRTVVFDLVVERKESECLVRRFDADPYLGAREAAAGILAGLGPDRCSPALRIWAYEGVSTLSFPDLEALAEDALERLGL